MWSWGLNTSKEGPHILPGHQFPAWWPSQENNFFLYLIRVSHTLACVHCPPPFHYASPRDVWLYLFCATPVVVASRGLLEAISGAGWTCYLIHQFNSTPLQSVQYLNAFPTPQSSQIGKVLQMQSSVKQKWKITSLNLLAALPQIQPKMWLGFLLQGYTADSCLTSQPGQPSISTKLLFSHLVLCLYYCTD